MLNLQLCNLISVVWAIKPHASSHWQHIGLEEKGTPCPRSFTAWHEAASITSPPIFSGRICCPPLSIRQRTAWHRAKLWAGTATRGSQLCSLPPFSALPAFAEIPSLGFASWMVAANASGGWKPDFPVYERGGCAGGCIFQERGVQYSFSFTRLNNSKNVPFVWFISSGFVNSTCAFL